MSSQNLDIIRQMQSFLIDNAKQIYQCHKSESFNTFIHRKDPLKYFNYSIPTKSKPSNFSNDYEEIIEIFNNNERQIRFEFLEEFAPDLPQLLSSIGLKEEYRIDFMVCTKSSFIEPNQINNFKTAVLGKTSNSSELKHFKLIQELAFNEKSNLSLDLIDEEDVILNIGEGAGFIGFANNTPVAASQYTTILNGVTELVSTATLPKCRNKGFGSAISATTTRTAFQNAANIVCLSAANENVSKIYANIGFKKIATMLAYS